MPRCPGRFELVVTSPASSNLIEYYVFTEAVDASEEKAVYIDCPYLVFFECLSSFIL